jgi:hypothetical protein
MVVAPTDKIKSVRIKIIKSLVINYIVLLLVQRYYLNHLHIYLI